MSAYLPPGCTQAQIDRAHEGDEPPTCPTCGAEVDGSGITTGRHGWCDDCIQRPENPPPRHFSPEERDG